MVNFLDIYFNTEGEVTEDFSDKRIVQNSHKVQTIRLHYPDNLFVLTSDYQYKVAVENEDGETLISAICSLDEIEDGYHVINFPLTEYYTQYAGELKMQGYVYTVDGDEYTQVFTTEEFTLLVVKGNKNQDYEILDPNVADILDVKINNLQTKVLADEDDIEENTTDITNLTSAVSTHTENDGIHVTPTAKAMWTVHISDEDIHVTLEDKENWNTYTPEYITGIAEDVFDEKKVPLQNDIDANTEDITTINGNIDTINTDITTLENTTTSLNTSLTTLNTCVDNTTEALMNYAKSLKIISPNTNDMTLDEITEVLTTYQLSNSKYLDVTVEDEFKTRTTADGLIIANDVNAEIESIQGNTIKSENLFAFADVEDTTKNGITYSAKNGIVKLNGTASAAVTFDFDIKGYFNGDYYYNDFRTSAGVGVAISGKENGTASASYLRGVNNDTGSVTEFFENFEASSLIFVVNKDTTLTNYILKPMIIAGNTAPTEFKQGFDGLKNSYITKITSYNGGEEIGNLDLANVGGIPKWDSVYKAVNLLNLINVDNDNYKVVNDCVTLKNTSVNFLFMDKPIVCKANTTYTLYRPESNQVNIFLICDNGEQKKLGFSLNYLTFSFPKETKINTLKMNGGVANLTNHIIIYEGNNNFQYFLPYNATTKYTKVVNSYTYTFDGTETWISIPTTQDGKVRFKLDEENIPNFKNPKIEKDVTKIANIMCDGLPTISNLDNTTAKDGICITNIGLIVVYIDSIQTASAMATFMNGKTIHFETEDITYTPITLANSGEYKVYNQGEEKITNVNDKYDVLTTTGIIYVVEKGANPSE